MLGETIKYGYTGKNNRKEGEIYMKRMKGTPYGWVCECGVEYEVYTCYCRDGCGKINKSPVIPFDDK